MTSYPSSTTLPTAQSRKKKPDWAEFYKNGIPQEIIVIDDDDDEPAVVATGAGPATPATVTNSALGRRPATSRTGQAVTTNGNAAAGPASKRRRTGVDTNYGVPQYDHPAYSIHSQQRFGEPSSEASISTDRTNSLHTTAPTSLGSHGSAPTSGVYYEDATVGQKRKRVVTRKSARDEQKRKELEQSGDAFASYIPPPKPPIKAKDVVVTVVRDVSENLIFAD
jgi:dual-specificity kinase